MWLVEFLDTLIFDITVIQWGTFLQACVRAWVDAVSLERGLL